MERFGKPLMERESDLKWVILLRVIFFSLGIGFLVGAVYMGFFMETEALWASILLAIIITALGVAFLVGGFAFKKVRNIIYEEGVFVANGKKEYNLHFSEIVGISDEAATDVTVSGGLVQVLVASAVVAAAGKIADAHNRKHRIRPINIWANIDGNLQSLPVVKTAGDVLSQLYTEWLIEKKPITADNLDMISLPFAKNLELDRGVFTLTHVYGGGETKLSLEDFAEIKYEGNNVQLCATDRMGRTKSEIELSIDTIYNLDLLHYIHGLQ